MLVGRIKVVSLIPFLCACAHVDGRHIIKSDCIITGSGIITVSIEVISDSRGEIGKVAGFNGQQFGIDFSKSDLQNGSHARLLEDMGRSAYTDHAPVSMRVRGEFKLLGSGRAPVFVVRKILSPE